MSAPDLDGLLARMTWADKLAQLQIIWRRDDEEALALASGGIGALFWPQSAERTNALQRAAVEESAHGIPLLIGLDVIHGQFTIFPTPLAQAASFDPSVAEADARVSAAEARSGGVNWTFSPMVDVTRDPRWGRVVEGFGEDSFLASALGSAKVRAYQGDDLAAADAIAACLKHFVAYGAAEAGRDYNTTDLSQRRLRETLPRALPRRRRGGSGIRHGRLQLAQRHADAREPPAADRRADGRVRLRRRRRRRRRRCGAAGRPRRGERRTGRGAAVAVRRARHRHGRDRNSPLTAVRCSRPGTADAARIDDAVMRILRLKQALGLFENPYTDAALERSAPTPDTLELAQQAAERCVVLLKNDDALLPVAAAGKRILLTGPYATSTDHLGAWVQHFGAAAGTLEESLRAELPDATWTVAAGAGFLEPSESDIGMASALAAESDLVIVAVGEPSSISGEASSRADIRLPGDQERLIHAIADTGVPFIVLLATGRPLVVEDWIERAPAVLVTWHLGTRGPEAIARVVSGAVNPGGRVPMTFPRAVGQIPIHHDAENTGRPAQAGGSMAVDRWDVGLQGPNNLDDYYTSKFLDLERGPRFAFGHGLSYTSFRVEAASLSASVISGAELRARVRRVTASVDRAQRRRPRRRRRGLRLPGRSCRVDRPAGAAPARLPAGGGRRRGDGRCVVRPRRRRPRLLGRREPFRDRAG